MARYVSTTAVPFAPSGAGGPIGFGDVVDLDPTTAEQFLDAGWLVEAQTAATTASTSPSAPPTSPSVPPAPATSATPPTADLKEPTK